MVPHFILAQENLLVLIILTSPPLPEKGHLRLVLILLPHWASLLRLSEVREPRETLREYETEPSAWGSTFKN